MANPTTEPAPSVAAKRRLFVPSPPRLGEFGAAAALCAAAAHFGLWFAPFVVTAATCVARLHSRGVVLAVVAGTIAGWSLPLWIMALAGLPVGATARSIAALAGLPPYAAVSVAATLLLAALQALAGAWLARAILAATRRPR